jgi:hypothetical protein
MYTTKRVELESEETEELKNPKWVQNFLVTATRILPLMVSRNWVRDAFVGAPGLTAHRRAAETPCSSQAHSHSI